MNGKKRWYELTLWGWGKQRRIWLERGFVLRILSKNQKEKGCIKHVHFRHEFSCWSWRCSLFCKEAKQCANEGEWIFRELFFRDGWKICQPFSCMNLFTVTLERWSDREKLMTDLLIHHQRGLETFGWKSDECLNLSLVLYETANE